MSDLQENIELAQGLFDYYAERNDQYKKLDDMFNCEYDLPGTIPDWVLKVVSTDPRDAVMTTMRTFSTVKPSIKIMPMLNDQANRDRANEIETALGFNLYRSGRRSDSNLVWDVMMSAARYGAVAAQVIYLPYQEKVLEAMGKDTRRIKAAKRFGDFSFIVHNMANVYPEWSEYGLEGVLTARVLTLDGFKSAWGKLANKLDGVKDEAFSYVTVFDYVNYDRRTVWALTSENNDTVLEGTGEIILDEENKLGFIPFAMARYGDSLSDDPEKQVMPLLQSIAISGQWNMLNVFASLDASLAITRAAQVQFAGEFPAGQVPVPDNSEPVGVMELPPGTRNFTTLPAQSVDQRVTANKMEAKAGIWQSTVAKALQTLEFPSGTAYSSVNQILSTAANSLAPYKMLGERTMAEICHQMLCWVKYYGKQYGRVDLYGKYDDKTNMGRDVRISSDTIDPDVLQIEVTLTADLPIDKLQQINGAVLVKQNFPVPDEELMEGIGYGNPAELKKRRKLDDLTEAYLQADLKRVMDAQALETAQAQMQMQMGAQQQQMEQQQAMAMQEQEAQMMAAAGGESPANENLGGMGFNPAAGGTPPVQGANGQGV